CRVLPFLLGGEPRRAPARERGGLEPGDTAHRHRGRRGALRVGEALRAARAQPAEWSFDGLARAPGVAFGRPEALIAIAAVAHEVREGLHRGQIAVDPERGEPHGFLWAFVVAGLGGVGGADLRLAA